MYVKKMFGFVLTQEEEQFSKGWVDDFKPPTQQSKNWKHWVAQEDEKVCYECNTNSGKIYKLTEIPNPSPPVHLRCRCKIETMDAIEAGFATLDGADGADWQLKTVQHLPDYYLTKEEAEAIGWIRRKGNLNKVAQGKMIGGDRYFNKNGHLPSDLGRIWFEADIEYETGYRGDNRILYSNDGLIFVTYDHYQTYIEII